MREKVVSFLKIHITIFIIWFSIGTFTGLVMAKFLYELRMNEAVKVGGLIYNQKVYDIKLRQ